MEANASIFIYFVAESDNAFRCTEQELGDVSFTDYPINFFLQLSFLFLGCFAEV
jgi:hypothetical protein